jgi:uncharacterized membrane protein
MEISIPTWGLAAAYWLHMLATVVWIGGLSTLTILVLPAVQRVLEPSVYVRLLEELQRRLDPIGWFCLITLGATGMFQMSANPSYEGFFSITNRWAVAILIKHLVFLVMIGVSIYITWGMLPELRRLAMRSANLAVTGTASLEPARLQAQTVRVLRLNLFLSVVILALTALARIS